MHPSDDRPLLGRVRMQPQQPHHAPSSLLPALLPSLPGGPAVDMGILSPDPLQVAQALVEARVGRGREGWEGREEESLENEKERQKRGRRTEGLRERRTECSNTRGRPSGKGKEG